MGAGDADRRGALGGTPPPGPPRGRAVSGDAVTLVTLIARSIKVGESVEQRCRNTTDSSASGVLKAASSASPTARLTALARAVVRLSPSRRDPERFHMDKSEIAA